jgi:fibronectin type 3 domain-containing protein
MKRILFLIILINLFLNLLYGATPAAPTSVNLTFDGTNIIISWVSSTASDIMHYTILRGDNANITEATASYITNTAGNVTSFVDNTADTFSAYYYRLLAVNTSSEKSSLTTAVKTNPRPPVDISITPFNSKVFLRWTNDYSGAISSYNIYRSSTGGANFSNVISVSNNEYIDTQVVNGITYLYKIAALYNGEGAYSITKTAIPFVAPFAPKNLSGTATGTDVKLLWSDTNIWGTYDIAGYNIYRATDATGPFVPVAGFEPTTTITSYTDSGLTSAKRYYYKVIALDINSNTSTASYCSVYVPDGISTPQGLSITSYTSNKVNLTWQANDSGENINYYKIYRDGVELSNSYSNVFIDTTVTTGESYVYNITAFRNPAESGFSNPVYVTVVPAAPVNFTVEKANTIGALVLQWSPAADEIANEYYIYRSTDAVNYVNITMTSLTSYTDSEVTTGIVHYYKIAAYYDIEGRFTDVVSAIPVTLPAEPSGFSGNAFNGYVYLFWDKNTAYDITSFNLYRSTNNQNYLKITTTVNDYYYDTGLTNNTGYFYKVQANNFYGSSNTVTSYVLNITPTASAPPEAPYNLEATSSGDGRIKLNWQMNYSSNLKHYKIYRATYAEADVFYNTTSANSNIYYDTIMTTLNVSSVSNTTTYFYRVSAVDNNSVESSASNTSSSYAFIRPASIDTAEISHIFNGALLVWNAPSDPYTFTRNVYTYNIYRATDAYSTYTLIAPLIINSFYADYNLNTGVAKYYYKIKTIDSMDNEDAGNNYYEFEFTNYKEPPPTLVAKAGDKKVYLFWSRVLPDSYNIYRRKEGEEYGAPIAYGLPYDGREYMDTSGLVNGTNYYYSIASVTEAGEGPKSNEVVARPYEPAKLTPGAKVTYEILNKKDVLLNWDAAIPGGVNGYDLIGYNVYRSSDNGANYVKLTTTADNTFTDTATNWDNIYYYLIKTLDTAGNEDGIYPFVKVELPLPKNRLRVYSNLIDLAKAHQLKLRYIIVKNGRIKVNIYTLSGSFVRNLIDLEYTSPVSETEPYESPDFYWDGKNEQGKIVSSGVYLIVLEIGNERVIEKTAVVR